MDYLSIEGIIKHVKMHPARYFLDSAYADQALAVHLDATTDQGTRKRTSQKKILRYYKRFNFLNRSAVVLEANCGPIPIPVRTGIDCKSHIAIEINPKICKYAKNNRTLRTKHNVINSVFKHWLRTTKLRFNVIILGYETLNSLHADNLREVLRLAHRALMPGGFVIGEFRPWGNMSGISVYPDLKCQNTNQLTILTRRYRGACNMSLYESKLRLVDAYLIECLRRINVYRAFRFAGFRHVDTRQLSSILCTDVTECRSNILFVFRKPSI